MAGVSGMIELKESKGNLQRAIRCIHDGELWINRRTTATILKELRQTRTFRAGQEDPKDMLSPRQREIVSLVAAVQTGAVAIVGEYVVRAYREAQGRPTWVVRRTIGPGRVAARPTSKAA